MSGLQQSPSRSRPRRLPLWRTAAAALLSGVMFLLVSGHATAAGEDGGFAIRDGGTRLSNGVWYVNARIDYALSQEALEALNSGLTLTVQLDIELYRIRRWLPDDDVASLRQDYELSFQPLIERYVVRNTNSGEQTSHVTLLAALTDMGWVENLPIIDAALLEPGETYEIAMRAVLDQQTLPGPLQLLAFWDGGFSLESEWTRWRLAE